MRHNKSLERDFCRRLRLLRRPQLQALSITKYSIVTNSNDSVTLRLMTEHTMLYEWLNRSYRRVVGRKNCPTLCARTGTVLAKRFSARVDHSIHCNAEWRPIGYAQSYVALGSGDGWWEEETDRVRGIDQSLAVHLGKGLGTKLVRALVELLFNDPSHQDQTDPSPSNLRAIRCQSGV